MSSATKSDANQLVRAARTGKMSAVTKCLQLGADVNGCSVSDQLEKTPLQAALEAGHLEIAAYLIERGANVSQADRQGVTPIHAAAQANSVNSIRLLVERGADPNAQDRQGQSSLMKAVLAGSVAAATELAVRQTVALELEMRQTGDTAFTLAAATGSVAMLSLLVRAGAEPRRKTLAGKDALEIAKDAYNTAAVQFISELYSRK